MDNFFDTLEQKYANSSDREKPKKGGSSSGSRRNTSSRGGKTGKGKGSSRK